MNREILFKAISKETGKWVEGDFYHAKQSDQYFIATEIWPGNANFIQIIPGTDCQFTGTTYKNGKKVFEGDIIRTIHFVIENDIQYLYHRATWSDKYTGWILVSMDNQNDDLAISGNVQLWVYLKNNNGDFEVIGNINDKLLKP